jgi:regulatory protein
MGRDGRDDGEPVGCAMARRPPNATPKPISEAGLHAAALVYLERFDASTEMVRRVLRRRVERAVRAGVAERNAGAAQIERVLARLGAASLLDDDAFAARRADSLQRRGASARAIQARLGAQGIDREAIRTVLATRHAADGDAELAAAVQLARRRRLGPFRAGDRVAYRRRDLGVMARAGFSAAIAHRIVDAEDAASLDDPDR